MEGCPSGQPHSPSLRRSRTDPFARETNLIRRSNLLPQHLFHTVEIDFLERGQDAIRG